MTAITTTRADWTVVQLHLDRLRGRAVDAFKAVAHVHDLEWSRGFLAALTASGVIDLNTANELKTWALTNRNRLQAIDEEKRVEFMRVHSMPIGSRFD